MESDVNRLYVVIFVLSVIIKAIYSAFEFAIVEVNDNKVKSLAENDARYNNLLRLISAPSKMRASFSVAKIFCVILIVICFVKSGLFDLCILSPIYLLLNNDKSSLHIAEYTSMFIFMILLVIFLNVFTEVIPRRIAEKSIDRLALFSMPFIKFIIVLFRPLTLVIEGISFVIRCFLFFFFNKNIFIFIFRNIVIRYIRINFFMYIFGFFIFFYRMSYTFFIF